MNLVDKLEYRFLRRMWPRSKVSDGDEFHLSYVPKIKRVVGEEGWNALRNKTVLDFGCGTGGGCIEMAQHGCRRVIGLDIRSSVLEIAQRSAAKAAVAEFCTFTESVDERVDAIVSIDAFEHFENPLEVLRTMQRLLDPSGLVIIAFGPTWYHPKGGHLFSVFPWSHLLFTETAQIRWRADFKEDGAKRFTEVEGGLNMISIARFVDLVERSGFKFKSFRTVPIRPLTWAHSRLTREFTTAVVECTLIKK